jgi:hypothetical protein
MDPITGKVLVVKTNDGDYAKIEIVSYYKENDASNRANGDTILLIMSTIPI